MAALRGGMSRFNLGSARLKNHTHLLNTNLDHYGLVLPSQLLFSRGLTSKLFVGGLSFYMTENTLSEAFSQFGQVIEAKIIMDRITQRSKGFGFLTFASEAEALEALAKMNGKILNGRVIFVENAKATQRVDNTAPLQEGHLRKKPLLPVLSKLPEDVDVAEDADTYTNIIRIQE
ncbi:glycine-rich RNA-binding protein 4, mitochondrial-like [Canna indica]|uniref:Glycine-rich RNA-binding protein 4, mitochondrial-like n=1 Tax=Canna indica TaxID=4628 RepID=A0AAQ3QLD3_9LILI|nr:glycine-rich RNA-binding protein 4, mitochondrial-like [Canna indica]